MATLVAWLLEDLTGASLCSSSDLQGRRAKRGSDSPKLRLPTQPLGLWLEARASEPCVLGGREKSAGSRTEDSYPQTGHS